MDRPRDLARQPESSSRAVVFGTLLAIIMGTLAILSLARDVGRQVEELASANTNTAQWSMAQADVEFLAFIIATYSDEQIGEPDLELLRRRHDIFYGRMRMLQDSPYYAMLQRIPEYAQGVTKIEDYISRVTPIIDGPNHELMAQLPQIRDMAEALRPDLRYVTLSSQRELAKHSDSRRDLAAETLGSIGILTLFLVAALIALVAGLGVLLRKVQSNAHREIQAHSRIRSIIGASIDGILVVDAAGAVTEANNAAADQLGLPAEDLTGRKVEQLITHLNAKGVWQAGLPPAGPHYSRVEVTRADGSKFPAECSVTVSYDDHTTLRICFLHDITDQLLAEEALVRARDRAVQGEKSKADMLAVMSHEMRTPLNGILGTLDLFTETRLSTIQREYLRVIRRSGDQLLRHVNDVLDISRLDAGKMTVTKAPFNLVTLLDEIAQSQRPLAEAGQNQFLIETHKIPQWVDGDAQKLQQVLLNLLSNAAKFTQNGTITLRAARLEGHDSISFSVEDTGIGIARPDLDRIFDEFVTLDASYGRKSTGTGLGLPISRRLVQTMGSELHAESHLGKGSAFLFTLKLPQANPPPSAQPADPIVETVQVWRPLEVLVIEDSEINRFVLRAMLEGDGHDVTEAPNGREGLKLADAKRYDLILMDIAMPELDGTEATRRIRRGNGPCRDVPIIALTAHALPADLERFALAGVTRTLTKPLTRPQLREVIALTSQSVTLGREGPRVDVEEESSAEIGLDLEQVEQLRRGLGDESYTRLMERFIQETTDEIALLGDNLTGDEAQIARAHTLAGSAAIFGASDLNQDLIALEVALRAEDGEEATETLLRVQKIWPRTKSALQTLAQQPLP